LEIEIRKSNVLNDPNQGELRTRNQKPFPGAIQIAFLFE